MGEGATVQPSLVPAGQMQPVSAILWNDLLLLLSTPDLRFFPILVSLLLRGGFSCM